VKKYTFEELNDLEFQDLVNDLLGKDLGCKIERFKPGKDHGIDGRLSFASGLGVIQSKHYRKSGVAGLVTKIVSDECRRARKVAASRYLFATSLGLNIDDKKKIVSAFAGVPLAECDVLGNDEINALLRQFPEVHRT